MGIKRKISNLILRSIPESIKKRIVTEFTAKERCSITYSLEGEDKLLERLMPERLMGVFVDIGAHHPSFISNTNYFYKKGWRGINIDAMPDSMKLFDRIRPEDINLELAISDVEEEIEFFIFSNAELNTFPKEDALEFLKWPGVKLEKKIQLKTVKLESVLDKYLKKGKIDFMSIDVEGFDLKVLQSNNWEKYSPDIILIEQLKTSFEDIIKSNIYSFLKNEGYRLIAKTYNTVFYAKTSINFNH